MAQINRPTSIFRYIRGITLRAISRYRTEAALRRLDDRLLADMGVKRTKIKEIARSASLKSVPIGEVTLPGFSRLLARVNRWRQRQVAILELSSLDDRLLRDIGVEPGQIGDFVDGVLIARQKYCTQPPVAQFAEAWQDLLVPAKANSDQSGNDGARSAGSRSPVHIEAGFRTSLGWKNGATALPERTANENRPPDRDVRRSAEA